MHFRGTALEADREEHAARIRRRLAQPDGPQRAGFRCRELDVTARADLLLRHRAAVGAAAAAARFPHAVAARGGVDEHRPLSRLHPGST